MGVNLKKDGAWARHKTEIATLLDNFVYMYTYSMVWCHANCIPHVKYRTEVFPLYYPIFLVQIWSAVFSLSRFAVKLCRQLLMFEVGPRSPRHTQPYILSVCRCPSCAVHHPFEKVVGQCDLKWVGQKCREDLFHAFRPFFLWYTSYY